MPGCTASIRMMRVVPVRGRLVSMIGCSRGSKPVRMGCVPCADRREGNVAPVLENGPQVQLELGAEADDADQLVEAAGAFVCKPGMGLRQAGARIVELKRPDQLVLVVDLDGVAGDRLPRTQPFRWSAKLARAVPAVGWSTEKSQSSSGISAGEKPRGPRPPARPTRCRGVAPRAGFCSPQRHREPNHRCLARLRAKARARCLQ